MNNSHNFFTSVAIEFDTYQSYDRTADPNSNHISVQTRGSLPNSADHKYSKICVTLLPFQLCDGKVHQVKIVYCEQTLLVFLDNNVNKPILTLPIDLSKTITSPSAWVGFTAATGGLNETHDILSCTLEEYHP
jgi:peptide-N4-(N-acetyl-beta-glucosaminyl)asparagine amidase